jgi:hypothetical protein
MAPGLDLDKAYKPPILQSKGSGNEASCSSNEDSSSDGNSSGNPSDDGGSSDYRSRASEEHLIDDENECGDQGSHSRDNLLSSDDSEPKKKVAKDGEKLVKMTCSQRQFVFLLEEMLSFHAWYKYSNALFGPNYESGDANDLLLSLHQMMACTNCILSLRGRKWLETAQAS